MFRIAKTLVACVCLTMGAAVVLPNAAYSQSSTMETSLAITDPENTLIMTLDSGDVVIQLRPDLAPMHVNRIKELVRDGSYDGVVFHRVIDGFMAQTGDVEFGNTTRNFNLSRAGTGGSGRNIKAEFTNEPFVRGTVGMARSSNPNSADSQFFICFKDAGHLNGQYTVIGQVISGMELVDGIKRGARGSGVVADPDVMKSLKVAADAE